MTTVSINSWWKIEAQNFNLIVLGERQWRSPSSKHAFKKVDNQNIRLFNDQGYLNILIHFERF